MTKTIPTDDQNTTEDMIANNDVSNQFDSDADDTRLVGACFAAVIAIVCVAINQF